MFNKKVVFLIAIVLLSIFLVVAWYIFGCPPMKVCPFFRFKSDVIDVDEPELKKVSLSFVGPWDNPEDWSEVISKFKEYKKAQGFDVSIEYKKIPETIKYEEIIREMQNNGNGPNIFMIFNSWMPRYKDKILPHPRMTIKQFKDTFARATVEDLTGENGEIYALPFYIDTLALYYNEDMFLNERLLKPPKNWDEFKNYVEKLTILDDKKNIKRAGAAFGGGSNINRNQDIIMLLIMQNNIEEIGGDITSLENEGSFAAIKFYTDFTDPSKRFYTWNEDQIYSIDAFIQRKAAMMINYHYQIENIRTKTGNTLNFNIAPIPQLDENNKVNYASYWVPVVANEAPCNTKEAQINCQMLSWEFLDFAARKENVESYLSKTGRASANIYLADEQASNFNDIRSVFASQIFTAKSWHHPDDDITDEALEKMIDFIVTNDKEKKKDISEAIDYASGMIGAK